MSRKKSARLRAGSSAEKRKATGRPFGPGNPYRWNPGQSGNPAGYPKGLAEAKKLVEETTRAHLLRLLDTSLLQAIGYDPDDAPEKIALTRQALAAGIAKGNPTLLVELLTRAAGKVKDEVEVSGNVNVESADAIARRIVMNDETTRRLLTTAAARINRLADKPGDVRGASVEKEMEDSSSS